MVPCPKGAIVRHDELAVLCDAVERAIEFTQIEIDSDHVVSPANRTRETREAEKKLKRQLSAFRGIYTRLCRLGANRPKIKLTEAGRKALAETNARK